MSNTQVMGRQEKISTNMWENINMEKNKTYGLTPEERNALLGKTINNDSKNKLLKTINLNRFF